MNIVIIVLGVIAASFGEIKFVMSGFLCQMGGIFFEAYRLALIQRLLSSNEQKMDPLVSLYYYAPICGIMIVVALIVEALSESGRCTTCRSVEANWECRSSVLSQCCKCYAGQYADIWQLKIDC